MALEMNRTDASVTLCLQRRIGIGQAIRSIQIRTNALDHRIGFHPPLPLSDALPPEQIAFVEVLIEDPAQATSDRPASAGSGLSGWVDISADACAANASGACRVELRMPSAEARALLMAGLGAAEATQGAAQATYDTDAAAMDDLASPIPSAGIGAIERHAGALQAQADLLRHYIARCAQDLETTAVPHPPSGHGRYRTAHHSDGAPLRDG